MEKKKAIYPQTTSLFPAPGFQSEFELKEYEFTGLILNQ